MQDEEPVPAHGEPANTTGTNWGARKAAPAAHTRRAHASPS